MARDLIAKTESEPGTLGYQWNLSEDKSICHIFERYQNAEAMLTHVQSFGAFATRFMEACHPTRFHIYGPANDSGKSSAGRPQSGLFRGTRRV